MSGRILITPRSVTRNGHPALERLRAAGYVLVMGPVARQPTESELLELLPSCVGFLAGVETISKRVLAAAMQLRVIARNGAGVNNVDLAAAAQRGIAVVPAAGANAQGVAELAIGLILALARAIPNSDRNLKQNLWQREKGIELSGRTLGLIGCGAVGRRVGRIAAALAMDVIGYDPLADQTPTSAGLRIVELDELFSSADVISLHCPPAVSGHPLLGAAELAQMRDGVLLVNTARAELVDNSAVLAALDSGKLAGLAIDVFRSEPPGNDPLVHHHRVIATPHVGGYTQESVDRAVSAAVDALLGHLSLAGAKVAN